MNLMPAGSILTGFFSSVPERIGAAARGNSRGLGTADPTSAVLPVDRPACAYSKSGNGLPVEIPKAKKPRGSEQREARRGIHRRGKTERLTQGGFERVQAPQDARTSGRIFPRRSAKEQGEGIQSADGNNLTVDGEGVTSPPKLLHPLARE